MDIFSPFEENQDQLSPNRNIAPLTAALDQEHRLFVGGCRLSKLAEDYGTPLYAVSYTHLTLPTNREV